MMSSLRSRTAVRLIIMTLLLHLSHHDVMHVAAESPYNCAPTPSGTPSNCDLATFIPYQNPLPTTILHATAGVGDPHSKMKFYKLGSDVQQMSMCSGIPHLWGTTPTSNLSAPAGSLLMYSSGRNCARPTYPGPFLIATQFRPARIMWSNNFPNRHPLDFAVESTLYADTPYRSSAAPTMAMQSQVLYNFGFRPNQRHIHYRPCLNDSCPPPSPGETNQVPGLVHTHGLVSSVKDDGVPGYTLTNKVGLFSSALYDLREVTNPPALLFYHDHALGFTRLNVYAGAVGLFQVNENTQQFEDKSTKRPGPPRRMPTQPCRRNCNANVACGFPQFPDSIYDVPLTFQDKAITVDGRLGYPTSPCPLEFNQVTDPFTLTPRNTRWAPEFFGPHTLVNGRVSPFLDLWPAWWRFRLLNAANARTFVINWPLIDKCWKIETEAGYLRFPVKLTVGDMSMMPAERIGLMCDFRSQAVGSSFEMTNAEPEQGDVLGAPEMMKINFIAKPPNAPPRPSPIISSTTQLSNIPNLTELFLAQDASNQITKHIMLREQLDPTECPQRLVIVECQNNSAPIPNGDAAPLNCLPEGYSEGRPLTCKEGAIEKWTFYNPTADFHPMHWHMLHAQCDYEGGSNEMRETVAIPNIEGDYTTPTRTCYVVCGDPQGVRDGRVKFGSNTGLRCPPSNRCDCSPRRLQYVFHCHILEHEDKDMMRRFQILTPECPDVILPKLSDLGSIVSRIYSATDGSGQALPAADGSGQALSAADGSGQALPAADGSGQALPAADGSGQALPAADGGGQALPAADGSGQALPAADGSGQALPAAVLAADSLPL